MWTSDAGGISVYSATEAQYGYALLWSLIPMTIALYVTEEIVRADGVWSRSPDLIREESDFADIFRNGHPAFLWTWRTWWRSLPGSRHPCRFLGSQVRRRCPNRGDRRLVLVIEETTARWRLSFFSPAFCIYPTCFPPFWPSRMADCRKHTVIRIFVSIQATCLMLTGLVGNHRLAPLAVFLPSGGICRRRKWDRANSGRRAPTFLFGSVSCM